MLPPALIFASLRSAGDRRPQEGTLSAPLSYVPDAATPKGGGGQHRLLALFFPFIARRINVKISHSRGHGPSPHPFSLLCCRSAVSVLICSLQAYGYSRYLLLESRVTIVVNRHHLAVVRCSCSSKFAQQGVPTYRCRNGRLVTSHGGVTLYLFGRTRAPHA